MVDAVGIGGTQDPNRFQHIAILGVNPCGFENPAKAYQQLDTRIVQTGTFLQEH